MSSEAAEKRLYVLAELDQRTQTEGIRLYSRLTAAGFSGRQTPGLPYHITLESFPCEEEGKVLSAVQKASGETEPISLTFSHIGVFGGGNVLFLAPDCTRELPARRREFELRFCRAYFRPPVVRNATLLPRSDKNPPRQNFFELKTGEMLSIFSAKSLLRKLRTTAGECSACGTFAPLPRTIN